MYHIDQDNVCVVMNCKFKGVFQERLELHQFPLDCQKLTVQVLGPDLDIGPIALKSGTWMRTDMLWFRPRIVVHLARFCLLSGRI